MAGLTGCAITGLVVVGWPIIGPGCTELPGIHPENLNFDIVYINQEIHRHCRHYWAGWTELPGIHPRNIHIRLSSVKIIIVIVVIIVIVIVIVIFAIFIIVIFKYCHCQCHY